MPNSADDYLSSGIGRRDEWVLFSYCTKIPDINYSISGNIVCFLPEEDEFAFFTPLYDAPPTAEEKRITEKRLYNFLRATEERFIR